MRLISDKTMQLNLSTYQLVYVSIRYTESMNESKT